MLKNYRNHGKTGSREPGKETIVSIAKEKDMFTTIKITNYDLLYWEKIFQAT